MGQGAGGVEMTGNLQPLIDALAMFFQIASVALVAVCCFWVLALFIGAVRFNGKD
jgi:hypothetical protein